MFTKGLREMDLPPPPPKKKFLDWPLQKIWGEKNSFVPPSKFIYIKVFIFYFLSWGRCFGF
jgi:hypothetical protein